MAREIIVYLEDSSQELADVKTIREKLVEAMSTVLLKVGSDLVSAINQQVGANIADEVKIKNLILPLPGEPLDGTGFEGVENIDIRVRNMYGRIVSPIAKFEENLSIGEIRKASLEDIRSPRISINHARFTKSAFVRQQG